MQPAPLAYGRPEEYVRDGLIRGSGRLARPLPWLATVAALFALAQLVLVAPGMGLGWDETVYVSQVSPHAPAAFFSAPRARGISLLVAPVTELTGSVPVLRCYLAVLSGGALFLGLWVWRRLLPVPVLALAGALFATLWITLFYGPLVMPNLWVAFAALTATGCFLRAVGAGGAPNRVPGLGTDRRTDRRTDRGALLGLTGALAVAALMRPTDALWLALPLALAASAVRSWRRPAVLVALVAGVALGTAEWVVEAYVAYGGLTARLHRASEIQGGLGWHLAFDHQLRALEGRSLCRPCDGVPWRRPWSALWWFTLPPFTVAGVATAVRARRTAVVLVPALTGLFLAVPYLLTIDYAAPRFLLPAYALLTLPAALCLVRLVQSADAARPGLRPLAAAAVSLVLVAHVGTQYAILHSMASRSRATRESVARIAAELDREGVRPPCSVSGVEAVRIGFRAGCASRQTGGHDGSITVTGLTGLGRREPVALLVALDRPVPAYARDWRPTPLPQLPGLDGLRAYLSPAARP